MNILQNAILIKEDGCVLHSSHVHDYVVHTTPSGRGFMLDGGREYLRRSIWAPEEVKDLTLTDENSDEEIIDCVLWGTRGIKGDQPLKWILLKDAETDHLEAILKNATPAPHIVKAIKSILESRKPKKEKLRSQELIALKGDQVKKIGNYIVVSNDPLNQSLYKAKLYKVNGKLVYWSPFTEAEHLVEFSNRTFYKI